MALTQRELRENIDLPEEDEEGWSEWYKAMVPKDNEEEDDDEEDDEEEEEDGLERRATPLYPNAAGFICSSIRDAYPEVAKRCGIYEWRAKGTLSGQPDHVVYLGSTCRFKPGALRKRILEYCTNGSHKADLINDALRRGYELHVRVKAVDNGRKGAEEAENQLLDEYDYAWNIRNNHTLRSILP